MSTTLCNKYKKQILYLHGVSTVYLDRDLFELLQFILINSTYSYKRYINMYTISKVSKL